jgi:hypothetical protein
MTHTDVIDSLLKLSHSAPPPERVITFQKLLVRVAAIQAQYARAREEHQPLAEQASMLEMRTLLPKIEATSYPVVGRLYHAGVALRDHLDTDLRDLRDGVRDARKALVGPESQFTSSMQALERDVERQENTVKRMATLVKVAESALDALAAEPFVSPGFVVPKLVPFFNNTQPTTTVA